MALVLKQMQDQQYHEWHKYVRLAEHTWNIMQHSVLGVSPFEAAHGLPARSLRDVPCLSKAGVSDMGVRV